MRACTVFTIAALTGLVQGAEQHAAVNPIRKVVTLLQTMQTRVKEEGARDAAAHKKFMCYCQTGSNTLSASIAAAEAKIPKVEAQLAGAGSQKVQAESELKQAQADRAAAKKAVADANALRAKEASAFASFKSDSDMNIAAIAKAVEALEKGVAGSFLQTKTAQILRKLAIDKVEMSDVNRQDLLAFLSGGSGYVPQSGEIIGILKQMGDEMGKSLADATADENAAIAAHGALVAAKKNEINALGAAIEVRLQRIGDLGVGVAEMSKDLADTKQALAEDKKFHADLAKNCETEKQKWQVIQQTRSEELLALADTIKVLNDDDALELFKKTLPSAANLMQVSVSAETMRLRAQQALRKAGAGHPQMDAILLALQGKKIGFEKVIGMIDAMVGTLVKEQADDDEKKAYCDSELDASNDKRKQLEINVADAERAIAGAEDRIATLKDEIAELTASIKALDQEVADMTTQRKTEKATFDDLVASDSAAKELLGFAKNRLNKFYNPKLYLPPPARELSDEDRIYESQGGVVPTEAAGGIAGTGITVFSQVAPAPPPQALGAYKKSSKSTGVIAMIDVLIADMDKELQEATTSENDAQADYETFMADAAEKRADDSKTLGDKESAKADMEAALVRHQEDKASNVQELLATVEYIQSLHADCDWLLKYFDARKAARTGEIEALKNAKAVLSGADYSLVQTRKFLRRSN